MANVINATSTANGGLITTGDDSGVLNIQTNETTAVSIDASQNATFTNPANLPNTFGFKNRIINGGMTIDQRNAGAASSSSATGYWVDRFFLDQSVTGKLVIQQNAGSVTPPAGFKNYLGVTSQSAYSVGSGDYYGIGQVIEGYNIADLGFGASGAATVTLSFWVRSSLTGTFGGALKTPSNNYSYPFTYTISAANTWEQKSITVTGATAGTWASTNAAGITVYFGLGVGTTYSGSANSWAATNYVSATGATSVVGTNGATFYITGVQLEKGTQATSFDFRSYGTELALCQRYYQIVGQGSGGAYSTTNAEINLFFPVSMRTTPSFTLISGTNALIQSGTSTTSVSSIDTVSDAPATYQSCRITVTSSGLTATRLAIITKANFAGASAEL